MASSSSGGYVSRYDVFLSFRGEDTRDSFTDHLYQALRRAGIYTFRDDDAIPRGEDLKPEIKRGIRESRASIIVLSELYATSRWCLDELYLILKQRKICNHFVLPVFYHVDPSHVRKREGTFKIEAKAGTKWTEDKVKEWNKALRKVGNMTGEVVCGPETDFIIDIVRSIKEKLDLKHVYRQGNLVGMETRDKEINYWVEQPDCEIIAISGIGGCGKTTLARHIAYSNWHKFEGVSILEDIGSRSTEELCQLKERLISDIIQGKEKTIPSVWQGTYTIKNALQRKKVLIVLDNIVTKKQVVDLLGTGTKTHSKFILTTREKDPSTWFESHPWRCRVHTMKLLDHDDSLKLLNLHAFKPNAPKEDYHEELAQTVLEYCQGNPLALEVLGSSLNRDSRKQFWKSILNSLVREVPGEIQSVLLTSYDSLHLESEKELFLHIACFFIGKDKDSVEKILEPDYSAISGIVTLINSSLLFVSPDNKLMMHRLLQEMAKTIVLKESPRRPGDRSRICHDIESYDVLVNKKGTKMVEGLALNMELLNQEHVNGQLPGIHELVSHVDTNSFERMNNLKLLLLNQLELTGSYTYFSQDLRLLRLRGFHLQAIPSELYMGKLVAIDMSCSKLKLFQPPYVLPLLKILDLRGSDDLTEICNISLVPNLETLILWSCRKLVRVCDTLGDHKRVTLLNITGCENLCKREQPNAFKRIQLSLFGGRSTYRPCFRLPISLKRLFAKDTNLEDTDYFPLTFEDQPCLEYINLVNSPFENLPDYTHLKNLLVLDLSFCRKLKTLLNLPCRLAELYTFYCISLERVTFESHKYTLQEFRYEGCVNLSEVEDFFKIVPVATLTGADLGHMNWLRAYQDLEMCLVGDDDLTKGRTLCLQMLYEFSIMSISLPDIEKPNMIPENEYTSEDPILSFDIPESHRNRKLRGLNLTFKYTLQGDECVWFAIIRTNNGVDLIYNPKVFGKPAADEVGTWLSYWPIGESLHVGDEVNVYIIVTKGLEINECGARLVYAGEEDEDESFEDSNKSIVENHESFEDAKDFFEDNNEHADILGGDIFRFKLSTGTYYLCRRDYCQLMEVGRLTPNWFRDLVGDTIDYTEIGGWRKTGRPDQPYRSYTKLKTVGSIIYDPHLEELYKIEELSKSCLSDKTEEYTSEFSKDATKDKHESANLETKNQSKAFDSDEIRESTSSTHGDSAATKAVATAEIRGEYPERAGQPECQYYMKLGTCKFGATCKFHHPRDKAGIAGRVSLNVLGYPLRTNEAECAFYMRTGQCKYGSTCKFHHPQPSNMMVSYLGSPAYPTVQSPTSPGQQSFPGGITNLPLSRARFISPRWQAPSNYAPMILPHSAVSGGSAYGKNKQEELYKIEELSKSSLSDKTEEYTSESSKVLTKFPHLKIELEAIKSATNEFDDAHCIGKGGFGKVYKGELVLSRGRSVVAIKRLDRAFGQGNPEFFREIIVRSLYKHDNIVSLLGFCDDYGEMILIYEYASKGSLDLYLNDKDLKWVQRLKICIGAARGLAYLHNPGRSQQRVLHRDIKSSNILIDDNWNARIADLGLSEFGPANQKYTSLVSNAVGTIGYYDPIYIQTGLQTKESDVYSFGVVLFEVLCGKLCIDNNQDERQPLTKLVHESYKQNTIDEIIYGNIKDEINPHSLKVFTTIALECLKREREQRPSITQVVERLERALRLQVSNVSTPPSLTPAEPSASPNKSPFSSSMSIQQSSHSESDEVKIEELEEEYMEHLERGNEARRKKT